MTRYFIAISALLIVPTLFMGACACERIYQGKVIDADTLQPLEGARVKASWWEYQGNFVVGDDSRPYLVKKTLTDNNGDWQIKGPKGFSRRNNLIRIISLITRQFFPGEPVFGFGMSGYYGYGEAPGGFLAYPVDEIKIKGIALYRPGNTHDEERAYFNRFINVTPLIIVEKPDQKLRNLDFSFQYPPDMSKIPTVGIFYKKGQFKAYTVVGLKRISGKDK
jgi:hypothetical protein